MELHELMHGDWLYNSNSTSDDNQYIKWSTKEVRFDASLPLEEYNKLVKENKWFHCGEYFLHNYIQPIEITEDILKFNDFKCDGYCTYQLNEQMWAEYYPYEHRLRIWWSRIDEWQNYAKVKEIIFQCHCTYVHELQHALKLAGLNNLADNFKIKQHE